MHRNRETAALNERLSAANCTLMDPELSLEEREEKLQQLIACNAAETARSEVKPARSFAKPFGTSLAPHLAGGYVHE